MADKLFTRTIFTKGYQEIVKAESMEEAKKKFIDGHKDVITDEQEFDVQDVSDIFPLEDMEVEDMYHDDE